MIEHHIHEVDAKVWLAPWGVQLPSIKLSALSADSRVVSSASAFLALASDEQQQSRHIEQAIAKGAILILRSSATPAVICRQSPQCPSVWQVELPHLQQQAGFLAADFFQQPSLSQPVAAITGTNGKTSCAVFFAQMVTALQGRCGLAGTLGAGIWPHLTTPPGLTTMDAVNLQQQLARFRSQRATHCVLEASSHGLQQGRLRGTQLHTAVFTNITQDHLDYHGSMDAYAAAKAKLFEGQLPCHIFNIDDPYGAAWAKNSSADQVWRYAWRDCAKQADVWVDKPQVTNAGLSGELCSPWGRSSFLAPLIGEYNISNMLAVVTMLCAAGFDFEQVVNHLPELRSAPGRMQWWSQPGRPQVVVDFAHTPDALTQVLKALRRHCAGQLWCVFGCGGQRDRGKRPQMAAAAQTLSDQVVVTADNPRDENIDQIMADIDSGFQAKATVCYIPDRQQAIAHAMHHAKQHDLILVAGKGHECVQIIGKEKRAFSDWAVVTAVAAQWGESA